MQKSLTFLAPFAVAACLALPAMAQDETGIDTVVATVNGTDITIGHMMAARAILPEQYQQLPDEVLFNGLLDQLVQQTALAQSFDGDLPRRIDIQLENERRSLTAGEKIEEIMAQPLDDGAVQAAYDAQYGEAGPEQEYNASHILVETEEEAKAIQEEIEGGADFETVAREKSTGPSGPSGGSLGWFGPGMMVPEFETAVVGMEPGAVSDPIQTQFGWHVIKLNEVRTKDAPALEEVRGDLELQVRQTRAQEEIEKLASAAEVDRSGAEGIDPAILKQIELLE
jgi:peptidyl-prolyl cis-trans isomerase C